MRLLPATCVILPLLGCATAATAAESSVDGLQPDGGSDSFVGGAEPTSLPEAELGLLERVDAWVSDRGGYLTVALNNANRVAELSVHSSTAGVSTRYLCRNYQSSHCNVKAALVFSAVFTGLSYVL